MPQIQFAQKAFIVSDRRLLLVRKAPSDPNHPGRWEVPGGRMEFGEEVDDHLKREVREEVGLNILPGVPFHIWQWRLLRQTKEGMTTEMQVVAVARLCEPESGDLSTEGRVEDDYLAEIAWVPFQVISSYDLIPNMRPVVASFLKLVLTDAFIDENGHNQ
jgi:8-oxo-dGTP pyrophosphatase MutT (NUDIX family)